MSGTWFKHYRALLDWEWRTSPNHFSVFCYCLERANFKDQNFKGVIIKAGSFPTSHSEISKKTGLTLRQVRYCISCLCKSGELVTKSSRKGTIITVVNWSRYQYIGDEMSLNLANQCQENVRKVSTIKKEKKEKKDKNVKKEIADALNYFVDNFNSRFKGKHPTAYAFGLEHKINDLSDFFPIEDTAFWDTVLDRIAESDLNWENINSKFNINWLLRDPDNLNRVLQGQWVNEPAREVDKFLDELLDMG